MFWFGWGCPLYHLLLAEMITDGASNHAWTPSRSIHSIPATSALASAGPGWIRCFLQMLFNLFAESILQVSIALSEPQ